MTPEQQFFRKTRQAIFETSAPYYEQYIMPAFKPLGERLVAAADIQPQERVLDLGTGVGAATLPASPKAEQVVGIDFAAPMFPTAKKLAHKANATNLSYYQGDMHILPHADEAFDVALTSFGFNATEPADALPEVQRVLKPRGRLVLQEWGERDWASNLVADAIQGGRVWFAQGFLADLRRAAATPRPWDQLGGVAGIRAALLKAGFQQVDISVAKAAIPLEPMTFYRYKTVWSPNRDELAAMPAVRRGQVAIQVMNELTKHVGGDGKFTWEPQLLLVTAWK